MSKPPHVVRGTLAQLEMAPLRTIRKDGVQHVALERRSGYVLLCRPNGLPGEVGVFGWSEDPRSFALSPSSCSLCAEALASDTSAEQRFRQGISPFAPERSRVKLIK